MSLHGNFLRRCLIVLAVAIHVAAAAGAQDSGADQTLIKMLEGYQKIMATPFDKDVEDPVRRSWILVSTAISKGFLRFTVDPVSDSIIQGARFFAEPGKDVTYIIVNQSVLDIWETRPSLAYSTVTMAVQDAAVFFSDPPAWGASFSDTMTRLYLRIDQYNAQALLIRDRLLPAGFLITPYEAFILDSLEKDKLASAIMFLERFSMPVVDGLYRSRLAFEEGADAAELRKLTNELGRSLLKNRKDLPSGSADETVYPAAVAVHTWLEFTPYIIARIHNKDRKDKPLTFDQILQKEKDYAETRRLLEASRITDTPMMNHVLRETVAGFEGRKTN
jgi:hypothetical protein